MSLHKLAICMLFILVKFDLLAAEVKIHVATEDWPPYSFRLSSGQIIGQATEKVRKVFKLAKLDYEIELYPWARAYHMAVTQTNTAIYTIMRTPQRESSFQWVCPLLKPKKLYFYRLATRNDIKISSLEDAKKYQIGVSRNEFDHQYLKSEGFKDNIHLDVAARDEINLTKLVSGRIEVMVESKYAIKQYLKRLNLQSEFLTALMEVPFTAKNQTCLALSLSTSKTIVKKLQSALDQSNSQDN